MRKLFARLAYSLPRVRGKDRIMRAATKTMSGASRFIIERAGIRYEVGGEDLIDYYIMANDYESPKVVETLAKEIGDREMCLWDIGANVGGVALPLLQLCEGLQVIMFEPSPAVCGRLMRNIQLNPELAKRARVMSLALSDRTGRTEFFISALPENSGIGGLAEQGNRKGTGLTVAAFRGDELQPETPPPDIIKIDVEGFEFEALKGLGALLDNHPPILFEHSPSILEGRGMQTDCVIHLLENADYSLRSVHRSQIEKNTHDDVWATAKSESANAA